MSKTCKKSKICKKLLSALLVVTMLVSTLVSGLAVSAETEDLGELKIENTVFEEGKTVAVKFTVDFKGKSVNALHMLADIDNLKITAAEIVDVEYAENYGFDDTNTPGYEPGLQTPALAIKDTNLDEGKILFESGFGESNYTEVLVKNVVFSVTFDVTEIGTYDFNITIALADYDEKDYTPLTTNKANITINAKHEAVSDWSSDADGHWHACVVDGCEDKLDAAAHDWNDGVVTKEAEVGVAGEMTYTCEICDYEKTEEIPALEEPEEPQPEYNITFGTQRFVRVYEPWTIRFHIRARDLDNDKASIPLSEFSDYGIYILPSYLIEEEVEITKEYIIAHGDKISSNSENMTNDGTYFDASYSKNLYTYMMGKDIYYLQYVVSNGVTVYREDFQTTSLETVLNSAYDGSNDIDEKNLISSMKSLYQSVVEHRGDEYAPTEKNEIPRVAQSEFSPIGESDEGYYFGTQRFVRVIEPWAIRFRNRIRNADGSTASLSNFDDYGLIVVKESDLNVIPTTAEELIANDLGYVFSKSNGKATLDPADNNYFEAMFDDEIYTYQMEEQYYYVRFYVKDGKMVCSSVDSRSLKDVLESALNSSKDPNEKAVINALIDLYDKVTIYRG